MSGRDPGGPPTLVAVAHGTRDPAGPQTIERLLDRVRARLPETDVVGCYLELVSPLVGDVLSRLDRPAVLVPLLLSRGYHVHSDLPAAAESATASVVIAPPLGPSGHLTGALLAQLRGAGAVRGDPVVLVAAGSSDPLAVASVRGAAHLLARSWDGPVDCGFLSIAAPRADEAIGSAVQTPEVHAGRRTVTVAPYLLAPGRFAAHLETTAQWFAGVRVASMLGEHPAVVDLVVRRYREQVRQLRSASGLTQAG